MPARLALIALALSAAPSAHARDRQPQSFDPAGRWLLTLPAGFEYDATFEPANGPGLFRLRCGANNLLGVYELTDNKLTLKLPEERRLLGLTWEVTNRNTLRLSEHPQEVGADYRGSTLGRQKTAGGARPSRRGAD